MSPVRCQCMGLRVLSLLALVVATQSTQTQWWLEGLQSITTIGANDWEAFAIDGVPHLVVANYGDGSDFTTPSDVYRWDGSQFVVFQSLTTNGAFDFESFVVEGVQFLVVANRRNNFAFRVHSRIYRWDGTAFAEFQIIVTQGACDWEAFEIDGVTHLAVANSYDTAATDPNTGSTGTFNLNSNIYAWDGTSFALTQSIPTMGALDWEAFEIDGTPYLVVAHHYNGATFEIDSQVYRWDGAIFVASQAIPTNGAYGFESFLVDGVQHLAAANNRGGTSRIYRWDGSAFAEIQAIATLGARAWTAFEVFGVPHLAIANQDAGYSQIFTLEDGIFAESLVILGTGARDWRYFVGSTGTEYLAMAMDAGESHIYEFVQGVTVPQCGVTCDAQTESALQANSEVVDAQRDTWTATLANLSANCSDMMDHLILEHNENYSTTSAAQAELNDNYTEAMSDMWMAIAENYTATQAACRVHLLENYTATSSALWGEMAANYTATRLLLLEELLLNYTATSAAAAAASRIAIAENYTAAQAAFGALFFDNYTATVSMLRGEMTTNYTTTRTLLLEGRALLLEELLLNYTATSTLAAAASRIAIAENYTAAQAAFGALLFDNYTATVSMLRGEMTTNYTASRTIFLEQLLLNYTATSGAAQAAVLYNHSATTEVLLSASSIILHTLVSTTEALTACERTRAEQSIGPSSVPLSTPHTMPAVSERQGAARSSEVQGACMCNHNNVAESDRLLGSVLAATCLGCFVGGLLGRRSRTKARTSASGVSNVSAGNDTGGEVNKDTAEEIVLQVDGEAGGGPETVDVTVPDTSAEIAPAGNGDDLTTEGAPSAGVSSRQSFQDRKSVQGKRSFTRLSTRKKSARTAAQVPAVPFLSASLWGVATPDTSASARGVAEAAPSGAGESSQPPARRDEAGSGESTPTSSDQHAEGPIERRCRASDIEENISEPASEENTPTGLTAFHSGLGRLCDGAVPDARASQVEHATQVQAATRIQAAERGKQGRRETVAKREALASASSSTGPRSWKYGSSALASASTVAPRHQSIEMLPPARPGEDIAVTEAAVASRASYRSRRSGTHDLRRSVAC